MSRMADRCLSCLTKEQQIKELQKQIEILKRFKEIAIEGWKGIDQLEIEQELEEWIIREHRKDKQTGEIAINTHHIPFDNVGYLWNIIIDRIKIGETTTSRKIAVDLITKERIPIGIDEMWGGKYRAKYYFPRLYYPLKILEHKGFIKYGGRGRILRLK